MVDVAVVHPEDRIIGYEVFEVHTILSAKTLWFPKRKKPTSIRDGAHMANNYGFQKWVAPNRSLFHSEIYEAPVDRNAKF